ncbi:twin-arginine translocase TatA/TatE family subunit [Lutibacter sp.]|uniref:twin-arginine translocase TatA/TatE family subunit n=1 Tax=Lutibacter sp. TaxID=1925666 RepID=UPI0025C67C87|nr:twin-arginine translocase TatA/TatE family subunit [Lutibacter sp.]MCF6182683.1 twin-arginine translocase TatA/TatE family subunit [Lutibacter sp.]
MLNIFLGMVGAPQVIIIAIAILLLFGGKKIPELMKGIGQGMKEFKKATKDLEKKQEKISE